MNFGFWILEGVRGFFSHRLTAAIAVAGMALSLWIFGFLYLAWENLSEYRRETLAGFQLEVFLDVTSSEENHNSIGEQISALDGIIGVEYISRREAADIFSEEFGEEIFQILEENPFPASFKVNLASSNLNDEDAERLAKKIGSIPGVDEVIFHGRLLNLLQEKFDAVLRLFLAVGGVVLLGTMAVFLQGIRLSIISRRNFVNALLLAGAKFNAVRLPFILEGLLTGIIAGVSAYAGLIVIQFFIDRFFITFGFNNIVYLLIPTGMALGLIGSLISVGSSLKGYLMGANRYSV